MQRVINTIFVCVILANIIPPIGQLIETQMWPVITGATLTAKADGIDSSIVSIRGTKNKNCSLIGQEWTVMNKDGQYVPITPIPLNVVQFRSTGFHTFGPWKVHVPADRAASDLKIISYHNCHLWWTSKTYMYDGTKS